MKTMSLTLVATLLTALGPVVATQAQSDMIDQGIDTVEVVKATATVEKLTSKNARSLYCWMMARERLIKWTDVFKI